MLLPLLTALSLAAPSHPSPVAAPPALKMLSTRCQTPAATFEVVIRSPTGDELEFDESVWIERKGQSPLQVPFARSTTFYLAQTADQDAPLCASTAASALPDGSVLVLLATDDRPQDRQLAAFVYAPATHRVTQAGLDLAPLTGNAQLRVRDGSAEFVSAVAINPSRSTCGADGSGCPRINGRAVQSIDDEVLTLWEKLSVEQGRLVVRTQEETFTRHNGEAGPLLRAGLDPKTGQVPTVGYRVANLLDGGQCFAYAVPGAAWACTPPDPETFERLMRHARLGGVDLQSTSLETAAGLLGGAPLQREQQEEGEAFVCARSKSGAVVRFGASISGGWTTADSLTVSEPSALAPGEPTCATQAKSLVQVQTEAGLRLGMSEDELYDLMRRPVEQSEDGPNRRFRWLAQVPKDVATRNPDTGQVETTTFTASVEVLVLVRQGRVVRFSVTTSVIN